MGSAIVHAVALILLAMWLVVLPKGRGPLAADFGEVQEATVPALLEDELLQSAEIAFAESTTSLDEALPSFSLTDPSSLKLAGPSDAGTSLDDRLTELVGGNDGRSATFFGTVAEGERFVFILDISGSMEEGDDRSQTGSSRFTRARRELLATIYHLYPGQEFAVLLFSGSCRPMFDMPTNRVTFFTASKANKSRITKWLRHWYRCSSHRAQPGGELWRRCLRWL